MAEKNQALKWKFETGDDVSSDPALSEGVVYFGSDDNHLYAVDIQTGEEKWKFETGDGVYSSPALSDGVVYFGSDDNHLYALDAKTGEEKWKFETGGEVYSSPAVLNGVVYFGSGDDHLYTLDAKTGEEKWKFKTEGGVYSPAVSEGVVYFGSDDNHLYALDSKTGHEKWKFKTGDLVCSSPVVLNGVVYFGSDDNHLYAVDIQTGEEKWKFETGGKVYSSPALSDGVVYFGSNDNHLYAVDIQTGEEKWKFDTGGEVYSSPAVLNGVVYFGSNDKHIYALDSKTGEEKWKFKTGDNVISSPVLSDSVVYCGSDDNHLYVLDIKAAQLKKKQESSGKEKTKQKPVAEDKYLEGYPRDPWKYMDYYVHPGTGEFAKSLSSTMVHGMKLPKFSRVEELFIHFTAEELSGIINKIKDTGVIPKLPFVQEIIAEKFPNVTSHHCPLWLIPYTTIGIDKPHMVPGMYFRNYYGGAVIFNAEGFLYRPVFEEFGDPKTFTHLVHRQWLTDDIEWMDGFYGFVDDDEEILDEKLLRTCTLPMGDKSFDIIEAHPPECPANLDVIEAIWGLFEENGLDYDVFREFSSWQEVIEWGKSDSDGAEGPVEAAEPTPYLDATTIPPYPGDLYNSNKKWDGYAYETIPFPRVVGPGTNHALDELLRKFTQDEVDAIAKKIIETNTLPRLVWIPDLFKENEDYLIQDFALKAPFWFMPFVIYGFEKASMLYFELSGFHANLTRDADALTQIYHVDAIGSLTVVSGHHEDDSYHGDDDECVSTMALKSDKGELWVSDIHGEDYGSQLPIIEAIWEVWLPMVDYNRDRPSFTWPPNLMEKLNLESFHSWDEVIEWAMNPNDKKDDSDTAPAVTDSEIDKSPMATAMSETYSNVESGKYNVLHAITYIYIVLAHCTDGDLSEDEMELIKKKLNKYCDEYYDIPIQDVIAEAIKWYDEDSDEDRLAHRVAQFDSIGAFLKGSNWFEKGLKEEFLQDMVDVAKIDNNFHKYEKQVIMDLAILWDVQGFDFTGDTSQTLEGDQVEDGNNEPDSSPQTQPDSQPEATKQKPKRKETKKKKQKKVNLTVSGKMSVGRFTKEFEKKYGLKCKIKKGGKYADESVTLAFLRPADFKGPRTVDFNIKRSMKIINIKKRFHKCFGAELQLFIGSQYADDNKSILQLVK